MSFIFSRAIGNFINNPEYNVQTIRDEKIYMSKELRHWGGCLYEKIYFEKNFTNDSINYNFNHY